MKRTLVIAGLTMFTAVATVSAHEHKVLGTVSMVAADHLMMKTMDGKEVTVTVNTATKVTKGKATMTLKSIKPGTRVVVTTASDEAPYVAMLIQVGTAPTPPGKVTASIISYPPATDTLMIVVLPDLQVARSGRNLVTGW